MFYLRGFPAGGDIFIDGVRDLGEYNRDVFATESVEVLKGPSALMFGRGSTGGVINQTTKAPGIVDRKEVALTFGNFDQEAPHRRLQRADRQRQRGAPGRRSPRTRAPTATRRT